MRSSLIFWLFSLPLLIMAAPAQKRVEGADACALIATRVVNDPHDVVSCVKSFPFSDEIRQNVMAVAESVINFYTFETTAISSPAPFEDTKVNLKQEFERIKSQHYDSDYEFNLDLYYTVNRLNDGHTMWIPYCYINVFQNLLPIPIVSLKRKPESHSYPTSPSEATYVIPDANLFFNNFLNGTFEQYYQARGINISRYEGAEVNSIDGQAPNKYVSKMADEFSGTYLDHGIRESMAYASYRYLEGKWAQKVGSFAGSIVPDYPPKLEVTVSLIPSDTNVKETVIFPYASVRVNTVPFSDQGSFWRNLCAVHDWTNGFDRKLYLGASNAAAAYGTSASTTRGNRIASQDLSAPREVAALPDLNYQRVAIDLPEPFVPTNNYAVGSNDVTYFTMLPNTSIGVMAVGSFYPENYMEWEQQVVDGIMNLVNQSADHLIIDVTNNPGGYVCAQELLHRILAGPSVDQNPSFEGVIRANELAREIMAASIAMGENATEYMYAYTPTFWNKLNGTTYGPTENFLEPPQNVTINGVPDAFSERNADQCTPWRVDSPAVAPFDFAKILIVGNGQCASACALFTTIMQELHGVKVANFGPAKKSYSGMAAGVVLNWSVLDSEVKTAGLKNNSLAGPDLLVDGDFSHNWRTAFSYRKPDAFLPYAGAVADYAFPYTSKTWNNPQALWMYVAHKVFGVTLVGSTCKKRQG